MPHLADVAQYHPCPNVARRNRDRDALYYLPDAVESHTVQFGEVVTPSPRVPGVYGIPIGLSIFGAAPVIFLKHPLPNMRSITVTPPRTECGQP